MHYDSNIVISLGCWTSLTESIVATDIVFVVNGFEVSLRASKLRWVLFMGYLPHEIRANKTIHNSSYIPHLHHSSFTKQDMEYAATHILPNLPSKAIKGKWIDWSMSFFDSKNGMQKEAVRKYTS